METGELVCESRPTRKGNARALRRAGRVPAVLYGPKTSPMTLALDRLELKARIAVAAHVRIIKLKSSAADLDGRHVIFKDVQRAPVSGEILHADLYEVDLNTPIKVQVALKFTGKAKGLANGGILSPLERSVLVECLPLEIPDSIEVDVTEVDIHDVVHISSLKFADNVKPIFDTDIPIVTVLPPTVAEVAVAAPTEAVEGAPVEGAAAEGAAAPAEGAAAKEAGAAGDKPAAAKKPEAAAKK